LAPQAEDSGAAGPLARPAESILSRIAVIAIDYPVLLTGLDRDEVPFALRRQASFGKDGFVVAKSDCLYAVEHLKNKTGGATETDVAWWRRFMLHCRHTA
jgi:hypothetical protein